MNALASESTSTASANFNVRDMFAAHLIGSLMHMPKAPGATRLDADGLAKLAFEYADAMVRAR